MTREAFISNVRSYMDAEGAPRWSNALITSVADIVLTNEWSDILNANRYYRFSLVSVTTDSDGRVPFADLSTGTGDDAQYFFRVLDEGFTDGNNIWTEVQFRDVPFATIINTQWNSSYAFYPAGEYFQMLPLMPSLALTAAVNYTPPVLSQLASDTSVVPYPDKYEWIPVWQTAATLLLKGGSQADSASLLAGLAKDARQNMLAHIARATTKPTSALYVDGPAEWNG